MSEESYSNEPPADDHAYAGTLEERRARDLVAGTLGADPYATIERVRKAGEIWAKAIGHATRCEHLRHTVLAEVKNKFWREAEEQGQKVAEGLLERLGRDSEEYRKHIDRLGEAKELEKSAETAYWAIRAEMELDMAAIHHYNALLKLDR